MARLGGQVAQPPVPQRRVVSVLGLWACWDKMKDEFYFKLGKIIDDATTHALTKESIIKLIDELIGNSKLFFRQLQVLLIEVEAAVNSRPLTYVSEDGDDQFRSRQLILSLAVAPPRSRPNQRPRCNRIGPP